MLAKLAERGDIGADDRVVLYITGDGLKTLDAVRDVVSTYDVEPTLDELHRDGAGRRRGARLVGGHGQDPGPAADPDRQRGRGARSRAARSARRSRRVYARYDGLRDRITENGELRRFVNVYVGGEDIRFGKGLETPVERRRRDHDPARGRRWMTRVTAVSLSAAHGSANTTGPRSGRRGVR